MSDRAPIRDRTLVLRILVPRLEERLREKMRDLEDSVASGTAPTPSSGGGGSRLTSTATTSGSSTTPTTTASSSASDLFWDLEGVSCEPTTARNKTLWNFHCDGATYPAKLVNLPCPVELHKTVDHAQYYKCQDVAQMLIVYEDDYALEEAEEKPLEGFPSYHPSGLTPPMKRVVERRFAAREHKAVAPPRTAVADVEEEITQLMEQLQKDEKGNSTTTTAGNSQTKRNKLPSLASTTKILQDVEEVVVDYEPWMDDGGKQPDGVEFDVDDPLATNHPELFLTPAEIQELKQQDLQAQQQALAQQKLEQEQAAQKKRESLEKKEKKQQKRNKKQQQQQQQQQADEKAAVESSTDAKPKKKGIASKKNTPTAEEVDPITQAAMTAMNADDLIGDVAMDDDFFKDLELDFNEL